MTTEEGGRWLASNGIETYERGHLSLRMSTTAYSVPQESGRKTALARQIMNEIFGEKSVVMVLEETGIFPSCENDFLFIQYRRAVAPGQNADHKPFEDYSFHHAEAQESPAIEGLIALSLYFIWGVTVFDAAGETFLTVSHDEWIEVGSNSPAEHDKAVRLLDIFGLDRLS